MKYTFPIVVMPEPGIGSETVLEPDSELIEPAPVSGPIVIPRRTVAGVPPITHRTVEPGECIMKVYCIKTSVIEIFITRVCLCNSPFIPR